MRGATRAVAVGCTGGIGAGKSTVSSLLAARGAVIVDADAIGRELTKRSGEAYAPIVEIFGPSSVGADGELDRSSIAARVFAEPAQRRSLEAIVHPLVEREILRRLASACIHDVVVIDHPLLVETDGRVRYGLDGLVVVDLPEDMAVERLVRDRKMSAEAVQARMLVQCDRAARLRAADFVIMNMGTREELELMVDRAWAWIISLGR